MDTLLATGIQALTGIASLLLVSLGLAIVFGMMRVINLAHGEFLMLGAYSAILAVQAGVNLWVAMLVVAPLCFTVILRAEPRDAPWIVAAGALAVAGGRLGAATLGVELGTFAGAFVVAVASSAYERWRHRPASVVLVPGILLLVPGSVGFRSLASLMERKALAGVETAFSMILTAVALVAGLLIAGVIAPEPRVRRLVDG